MHRITLRLTTIKLFPVINKRCGFELEKKMDTKVIEVMKNFEVLKGFVSHSQLKALEQGVLGEESQYFIERIQNLVDIFNKMPKTYETEGQGEDAIIYFHYFKNGVDWFIIEKDREIDQYQAFGYTLTSTGSDLGYISLVELAENDVEIDLHWTPKPVGDIK